MVTLVLRNTKPPRHAVGVARFFDNRRVDLIGTSDGPFDAARIGYRVAPLGERWTVVLVAVEDPGVRPWTDQCCENASKTSNGTGRDSSVMAH